MPRPASLPDVVIVGGGIVGTSAAAFLAGEGARVTLIEAREIAAGASGRNSGVVQHPFDASLRDLHLATVAAYRALAAEDAVEFVLAPMPAGLLLVGLSPDGPRRMATDLAGLWPELEPSFVDGDELQRLEPSLAAGVSACRLAIGYPVPPAAATRAYVLVAARRGAVVRTGSPVAALVRDGQRAVGVRLTDGTVIPAGAVLIAAGPWSPALVDPSGKWRPIRPAWGVVVEVGVADPPRHVLEEAEMDDALGALAASRAPGTSEASGDLGDGLDAEGDRPDFSLVTAGGHTSLGSTFLEAEPDADAWVPRLLARGRRYVPGLATAPLGAVRACARPMTLDGRPLLGPLPGIPGAFIAAGHGPWGISTGPASARLVGEAILGRPVHLPAELYAGRFGRP
ncbi:MAG: NAD(P)/FAD-dependent oxidoreductase [Candidatus Limnocylindrales bacterium]